MPCRTKKLVPLGTQHSLATARGDAGNAVALPKPPISSLIAADISSEVDGVAEQARHLAFRARREPVAANDVQGD